MTGGCLCGAIRYKVDGTPRETTNCHCLHCRLSSGAPFVTWIEFDSPNFTIEMGSPARYESRPGVIRRFCGQCGTQLTYQRLEEPEWIDVTACSLDDVTGIQPEDHLWCARMAPWVKLADGLPRYERGRAKP